MRARQRHLARSADLGEDDVAGETVEAIGRQAHGIGLGKPGARGKGAGLAGVGPSDPARIRPRARCKLG
jgi:hypothetical protein